MARVTVACAFCLVIHVGMLWLCAFGLACLSARSIAHHHLFLYLCQVIPAVRASPLASPVCLFDAPSAMDAKTAKRVAQIQRVKGKPYFRAGLIEEPDPLAVCATRMWKWKMSVWVQTLKQAHARDRDQQLPHEEDPAPM